MFFELVAVIVAGFAAAGIVLLVNKALRGLMPKWMMPVAAGAGMIAMAISNEYGWYPRTLDTLPEGVEVATTVESKALYRPWTYAVPFVNRFIAVDTGTMRTNPAIEGQRIVDVYAFARWQPTRQLSVAVDCVGTRRADLDGGTSFGAGGTIEGAKWLSVGADDPIVQTACGA